MYLLISDEIKLYKRVPELCSSYRSKKIDGKFAIINKATKETVALFDNQDDQENWFYREQPIDNIFIYLRSNVVIQPGTTLGDLKKAIVKFEELDDLLKVLFPTYPELKNSTFQLIDEPAKLLMVKHSGVIQKFGNVARLTVCSDLGFDNNCNWDDSTEIQIDNNFDSELGNGVFQPSLLEFLKALYGIEFDPCAFMEDGVYNGHGYLIEEPLTYLLSPCAVSENLTLGDVFNFVEKHEILHDFIAFYSWCRPIDEFHAQAKLPNDENDEKIWHLEIYRRVSLYVKKNYFNFDPNLHGIGELSDAEKQHYINNSLPLPNHTNYGISCAKMNNLAHLPIHLNYDCDVYENDKQHKVIHHTQYKMDYTLLDILDAIYWEISFFGGPEDNLEKEIEENFKE